MKRLLTYLKPHKWVMTAATLLVLLIIVIELYRPIIIGNAIDDSINDYHDPYTITEETHKWVMTAATLLVLLIIVIELYRPIIIGNAIDDSINDYHDPYTITEETSAPAVSYNNIYLTKDEAALSAAADGDYYQLVLYNDRYYMAERLSAEECRLLRDAAPEVIAPYIANLEPLGREQLLALRRSDFADILSAAAFYLLLLLLGFVLNAADTWMLQKMGQKIIYRMREDVFTHIHSLSLSFAFYLLLLLLGFVLNAADTWMLQKMGQKIIYRMREDVFTHIHSLSLSFFNNTPVGKLVTRVSNDTEAINELFTTILVKLFKNTVKIIGYAVVMLSIDVRMAGISFLLLPLVAVLTFLFRLTILVKLFKNTVKIIGYAVVMLSIDVRMAGISFLLLPLVAVLTFLFRFLSRKAYQITRTKITELNTFLSEHISGMRLIQIFAREKEKYAQFEKKSDELFAANWREVMTFAVFRPSIYFVSVLAMILVIGYGAKHLFIGAYLRYAPDPDFCPRKRKICAV